MTRKCYFQTHETSLKRTTKTGNRRPPREASFKKKGSSERAANEAIEDLLGRQVKRGVL